MNYTECDLPKKGDRVVVGLSGGVDSTMAALLLKEKGCDVTCVTMTMWDGAMSVPSDYEKYTSCYSPKEESNVGECRAFCEANGMKYFDVDVRREYREKVLDYFKSEYRNGRTPNPCVRCNQTVKFGALLEGVKKLGIEFDYFCTGHYARIVRVDGGISSCYGKDDSSLSPCLVCTAIDAVKDQCYFLNRISSDVLEKVRFPLGHYTKKDVVEMARKRKLPQAAREESQDFLAEPYIEQLFDDKKTVTGDFISLDGKVLGHHRGIEHYTIGQRRGLGIGGCKEPLYVAAIDREKNVVVLGNDRDLFSKGLVASNFVWPAGYNPRVAFDCMVKIRLASKPVKAHAEPLAGGEKYEVSFETPQRSVAPGQSVVFYTDDGITLSGAIIESSIAAEC